jgi:uncharacterized protein
MKRLRWSARLVLLMLPITLCAAFPKPIGFVNDFAGVLDADSRAELDRLIRETERATSAEIAVVTVSSLDGMSVEEYANRLFQEWGLGKKADDNGVLILVATAERKMRIEVGYGLEGVLPDGLAGEIIRTDFLPEFRRGQYSAGVLKGTRRVTDIVQRNQPLTPDERRALVDAARSGGSGGRPAALVMVPFLGGFIAFGAFVAGLGFRARSGGPLLFAGLFAGFPLLMALFLFFSASFWILLPLGMAMFFWGHSKGRSAYWKQMLRGSSAAGDDSTAWTMGPVSSGSSGSGADSGSSGGDFGGGSSGGGGASGSW